MAGRKKVKKVQVSSMAKNMRAKLEKDLGVKKAVKDYDQITVKRTRKKIKARSKAKKRPMDAVRSQFIEMQKDAMARVKLLKEAKVEKISTAYQKALETKPKSTRSRRWLFDVKDTKNYRQLQREINRMQEFLNSPSSTVEGALWEAKEIELYKQYKGAFGNQWKVLTGSTFDPSRIDNEYVRAAGRIYRMLEDVKGVYGIGLDEGAYDSETTFYSIYDMVVKRNITLDDDGNPIDERAQERSLDTLLDIINKLKEYKEKYSEEAQEERKMGNTDSRSLRVLRESSTAKEFKSKIEQKMFEDWSNV